MNVKRIPYLELTPDQQEQIRAWLHEHRIDPARVPIDAQLDYDPAAGEWRIPAYRVDRDGRKRVDPVLGKLRINIVRRRQLRPLPWPWYRITLDADRGRVVGDVQIWSDR